MPNPTEIPDFYGYGSDIEVSLTTGKWTVKKPFPRFYWSDLALILTVIIGWPWILWSMIRCWRINRHVTQCEAVIKDEER